MDAMEDKILSTIDENENEFIELLRKVIKIPSLTGEEGEAQKFLAGYLGQLGLEVDVWEPDVAEIFKRFPEVAQYPTHWQHDLILPYDRLPSYNELVDSGKIEVLNYTNRPNVVGKLKGQGGGKSLLLNGHIDTVTVEPISQWTHNPFGAEMIDGSIYGRGASDMKGGLIASLCAVQALIEAGSTLKGDLIFSSVVNEEHSGNGTLALICKDIPADAAIVTEPSANKVFVATPGDVYWELTLDGVPRSPGARWDGKEPAGISAIEKLPLVIESLLRLEEDYNAMTPDPLYATGNPFSCVMGEISGGTYATVTAHQCVLKGCIYFGHGLGSVNDIMDRIKAYVAAGTKADPWFKDHPVKTSFLHHRNSSKSDPDHPMVKTLCDAVNAVSGHQPKVIGSPYCADMDMLINQGNIPTIIYGPGSIAHAHKADECIAVNDFLLSVKALALAIYQWCNS
jgi:acetylornithine deacetylase